MRVVTVSAILALFAFPVLADGSYISGKDLKSRVEDGSLLVHSSADYEFPVKITLRADGTIEGLSGNGYVDSGSWWLRGDTVCHRWEGWFDGLRKCYAVIENDAKLSFAKASSKHFWNTKLRKK